MIAATNWGRQITRRKRRNVSVYYGRETVPIFPPYLKPTVALVEKVWEILKGFGRDSIDRLRRNLYSLWANDALNGKVNNWEGAFRRGTGKVCFSGVLKYIYEIFEVVKCHGARQSSADLRRLSKSPVCRQSAR